MYASVKDRKNVLGMVQRDNHNVEGFQISLGKTFLLLYVYVDEQRWLILSRGVGMAAIVDWMGEWRVAMIENKLNCVVANGIDDVISTGLHRSHAFIAFGIIPLLLGVLYFILRLFTFIFIFSFIVFLSPLRSFHFSFHFLLRSTMANNHLSLFCLVDGESTSNIDISIVESQTKGTSKCIEMKEKGRARFLGAQLVISCRVCKE